MPENAEKLERPEDIFKSSLPYGIIPLIISFAVIAMKWFVMGERTVNPLFVPIGILVGFFFIPIHEVLHAVCYGSGKTVYIGVCVEKVAAFAVCHEAISRRRFIAMSLLPMLLGIIPLVIFLVSPPNAVISGICIPSGIMGMLSPMPDYMDVHIVCTQTSGGAFIQTQNDGLYWFR